jgi:hypothetical protein
MKKFREVPVLINTFYSVHTNYYHIGLPVQELIHYLSVIQLILGV